MFARSMDKLIAAAAAATLLPTAAFAHPGAHHASGLIQGFMHPVSGIDHILAMVLVGLLAWQIGGRALWMVPATFLAVMAAAGAAGVAGMDIPLVETGIALSVVVLGAVVASGVRAPLAVAMGLAGLFAIFHGHAHGAEMPSDAAGLSYGLGFLVATAALHLGGIGAGVAIGKVGQRHGALVFRAAGSLAMAAGVVLLVH